MTKLYQFLKKLRLHRAAYFAYLRTVNLMNYLSFTYNSRFKKGGRIVLYHRIASVSRDPHDLCVSPEVFEEHLKYFSSKYELVSLEEIGMRSSLDLLSGKELAVTFDDGYRDNLENALPLLEKYQVPVTIFVTTGCLGERASSSWDREYSEKDRGVFLSKEEVLKISRHPLVTVGAHTVNHPNMASISRSEQEREIRDSRLVLEGIIKNEVREFAFPFGGPLSYTAKTLDILKGQGFDIACTTSENIVTTGAKSLKMPRFNVRSYTIEQLADKLK